MSGASNVAVQVGGGLGNQLFGLVAGLWASHTLRCGLEVDVSAARPENLARGEVGYFAERNLELDSFFLPNAGDGSPVRLVERPFRPPFRGEMRLRRAASRLGVPSREYWPTPWTVDERILDVSRGRLLRGNFHTWGYWRRFQILGGNLDLFPIQPTDWFRDELASLELHNPVALHIRLGDYTKVLPHLVSTAAFIQEALDVVARAMGNRAIWLFSDDPTGASELLGSLGRSAAIHVVQPPPESRAVESLYLLSRASSIICSASSFSIWSAQIATNCSTVIVPVAAQEAFGSDGFSPEWLILPNQEKAR